ncbi:two-component system CitB family sensor kinase [Microterricola gilva]|uniref:histidine kinase n=2 Tax=Microterricola gilva TaxID=393267 RepID=A0A4Q8AME1_9MICO|nr:two-component system CitB family sensor kinase [Microterricola gilva]
MSLRVQLVLLQLVIVLGTVLGTGATAIWLQERQLRDAYLDRMIAVAQSIASLPAIFSAFDDEDPAVTVQPIAELIRDASDVTYVVVANADGIRYSHPNTDLIGKPVSTDPSIPLSGEIYVGTQTGTLGESWRVKVPVFDGGAEDAGSGAVIGQVSVGILESELRSDFVGNVGWLLLALTVAASLGVVASAWLGAVIRRRIFGLEPEEIRGLLETREAMLHGIREGLVAVDQSGRIVLMNDAAARLLDVPDAPTAVGQPISAVLDEQLVRFIASGEKLETLALSGERVLLVHSDRVVVDGREIGSIAILRDRTELEAVLRDLQGAQSLADGLRAQSHEFANKLHVVNGLLELGHIDAAMDFIERAGVGGALSNLDEDSGIADIELSALLLAKRSRAQELGITVSIGTDSHLLTGSAAARSDLLTVVGNVVDNALDACVLGGTISVSVRDDEREGWVHVLVDDDGPGVQPEDRDRIFESGITSKELDRGRDRRGIGLTIVRRVAERLGGSATVSASPLGGARFSVWMTRVQPPAASGTLAVAREGRP